MEIAASRGGSPAVPSPSRRKDRRTVPDLGLRNNGPGVSEHGKLGQSDERTIYEKVQEEGGQLEMSFSSVAIDDAGAGEDLMQRRLHSVSRKREELEQMEVELKAQIFARSEIMEVQRKYETQIKEHINAIAKLKEQLHEREQCICTLEMKVEDKDRELRAAKIDNEAVWAKEDLLREQNKELANMRRECEGLEAERAQHIKQIHDLQECIQGKEHRYLELEEQHRVAQETILFKDEQLREAQAWMVRAQEVDAFHLTTNQTLQAEIRERTEQFNQYFLGLHKQFAEVDRQHRRAIQQLQLELAEAKEQSETHSDDSTRFKVANSKESSPYLQGDGGNTSTTEDAGGASLLSAKSPQMPGVPLVQPSIVGMGAFIPPGPVIAPHPFVVHPPVSASYQHWPSQQVMPDVHQSSGQSESGQRGSDSDLALVHAIKRRTRLATTNQKLFEEGESLWCERNSRRSTSGNQSSRQLGPRTGPVGAAEVSGVPDQQPLPRTHHMALSLPSTSTRQLLVNTNGTENLCMEREKDRV